MNIKEWTPSIFLKSKSDKKQSSIEFEPMIDKIGKT
jgi:hypothetical protein